MMFYFVTFAALCGVLVLASIIRPRWFFEFPFFMAATFAGFLIPQVAPMLFSNRMGWPESMVSDFLWMSTLCVAACWIGYQFRPRHGSAPRFSIPLNWARFFQAGVLFIIVGFIFDYLIEGLPQEAKARQWTGIVTIYGFFRTLIYPGFAICLYCAVKKRWAVAWVAASISALVPLRSAIFYARREATVLFVLTMVLTLFFIHRRPLPRWLLVSALVGAALFIPATGQYRGLALKDPWEAFRRIDFFKPIQAYSREHAVSEARNGMALIAAARRTETYRYGIDYWNQIVSRFVPAQFLGDDSKNSLMIGGERDDTTQFLRTNVGYTPVTGTTITGVADSFRQFWFFGCLVFVAMGWLFRNLWAAAEQGAVIAQILYIESVTTAMRAVTHQTVDFLPGFLYSALFLWLVVEYARLRPDEIRTLRVARSAGFQNPAVSFLAEG